jgi:REP element-mobilizing transposase RayT
VPHARRPPLPRGCPLHVTLRVVAGYPRLRRRSLLRVVRDCIAAGHKPGFAVCEFSLLPNHFHLVVEAQDRVALSRGLQGLKTRLARRLNRALGRRGTVFAERYHARTLRTPSEVRRALAYVLLNARRHAWQQGRTLPPRWIDPCSSGHTFRGWREGTPRPPPEEQPATREPATWLLRVGWRRRGLVSVAEVPGA